MEFLELAVLTPLICDIAGLPGRSPVTKYGLYGGTPVPYRYIGRSTTFVWFWTIAIHRRIGSNPILIFGAFH